VKKIQKVREGNEAPKGAPQLAMPQIGLLLPKLNEYFSQERADITDGKYPMKVKAGAQGFLRVGVENRIRFKNDSFLAAVAPFFGKSSARTMKQFLADIIQPRIFMALNYGNLALEMYKAGTARPKISERLKLWAKNSLRIRKVTPYNEELVIRAYMAYSYFQTWLDSDDEPKEYRHFAHLFMQPGILQTGVRRIAESGAVQTEYRRPGVIFIVLDMLESGEIRVRCPPYPINKDMFAKSDIGFLFHHYSGIWEPIFYVDNRTVTERDMNVYYLLFSNTQRARWPAIVEQRVQEFSQQCASRTGGKGIYTSLAGVPSNKIIGLNVIRQQLATDDSLEYYGMVRDAYNHIGALIYKTAEGAQVAIPVVDDGISVGNQDGVLVLDWDDFDAAPIAQVVDFYSKYIEPRFPKLYGIRRAVVSEGTRRVEAIQLANGLYVPVASADPDTIPALPESVGQITEMEWTLNRKIAVGAEGAQIVPGEEDLLEMKEFTEVYEHLRLTFSNWLASLEDGGEFRESLEHTITRRDLPLFEMRKRLEIMLGSEVESWLTSVEDNEELGEEGKRRRVAGLLRFDSRLRPQAECSGMCAWVQSKEKCLLHAPSETPIEEAESSVRILLLRLIDELLRYGGKRKQLFQQTVSRLAVLDNPLRVDDQYILPERSAKWAELLRLDWAQETAEKPKFLEEMTQAPQPGQAAAAPPTPTEATTPQNMSSELPPALRTFLGEDDPLVANLKLYPSPTGQLKPFLADLGTNEAALGLADGAKEFTEAALISLVRKLLIPVVQIDLRGDAPVELVRQPARDKETGYPIFVLRSDGPPAMLVTNTEDAQPLQKGEVPEVLKAIIKASKKLFVKIM